MARIRSNHPGQWSDEDFVRLSYPARLLALGIRNIADDHGVFEWKPLTLKMQLFPADAEDVEALLSELVENKQVLKFEVEGKSYGAVRNFMKWQRPKKPSYCYPVTEPVLEYVGFKSPSGGTDTPSSGAGSELTPTIEADSSEPVPHQYGTGSEKPPQRKEVGGRREEGRKKGGAGAPADFAFSGKVIRLKRDDIERWRESYGAIADIEAELTKADDFYHENPPKDGKWYFPVSRWLAKAHDDALKKRQPTLPSGKPIRDAGGNLTVDALFARG